MLRTAVACILLTAPWLIASGCQRSGTVPVKGNLQFEGQPLAKASVTFLSQEADGRDANGFTDSQGAFRLTTFEPDDGALPGKYKVIVQLPQEFELDSTASTPAEVQAAMTQGKLKPKPGAIILPPQYNHPDQTPLTQDIPAAGEIVINLQSDP